MPDKPTTPIFLDDRLTLSLSTDLSSLMPAQLYAQLIEPINPTLAHEIFARTAYYLALRTPLEEEISANNMARIARAAIAAILPSLPPTDPEDPL